MLDRAHASSNTPICGTRVSPVVIYSGASYSAACKSDFGIGVARNVQDAMTECLKVGEDSISIYKYLQDGSTADPPWSSGWKPPLISLFTSGTLITDEHIWVLSCPTYNFQC